MRVDVHHVVDGPEDAPAVVLSGSLGSTLEMWEPQVAALASRFRLIRYDLRGHGGSPVPGGPYSIADLGGDVLRLLDRIGAERVHFAGLSIGGMIGMWLAAHAPERIDRLALLCTSPDFGEPESWEERASVVRTHGTGAIASATVQRWFTAGYTARNPEVADRMHAMITSNPREGYAGCCEAIGWADLHGELSRISSPTLVIAGAEDPACPPEHAESIAGDITGARLHVLDGAAHLASWERADEVNELLRRHLTGCG